jgi:excisionase family DNA binding protein
MTVQDLPGFYRQREVAEASGLSLTTIKREVKSGRLKGKRIGRCWRCTEADYRAWQEALPEDGAAVA